MRLDQLDCEARLADTTTADHHQLVLSRKLQERQRASANQIQLETKGGQAGNMCQSTAAAGRHEGRQRAGDCARNSAAHKAVEDPCDLHMAGHRLAVGSSETDR